MRNSESRSFWISGWKRFIELCQTHYTGSWKCHEAICRLRRYTDPNFQHEDLHS